jgi:hypothetical protein
MNIYEKKIKKSYFILLSNKKQKWVIFLMPSSPSLQVENRIKVLLNPRMAPMERINMKEEMDLQDPILGVFPHHEQKEKEDMTVLIKKRDHHLLLLMVMDHPLLMVMDHPLLMVMEHHLLMVMDHLLLMVMDHLLLMVRIVWV